MSGYGINDLIDAREGKGILGASLVKVFEVDAQAPGFVLLCVRTPIRSHTDLACNTSYRFAASRTVFPRVPPYLAWDRLRLLAHVYDSAASIHMTKNPG